ncbi:MAG TPA: aminotransferase class V-fold PLP-dependent enzyme, partial [Candidatus Paceibacterota bacterium]|nr:aminotransferase class V-fold PLP-dependent enzyme [Candidatus Paceibacterota bacterium]
NPSSPHAEGRAARAMLEDARTRIARLVEAKPDDVVFTSGATEANALAILGVVRANHGGHVLYDPGAHASIVENVRMLAREGAVIETLSLRDGRVDIEALRKLLRPETVLVAMEAVNGETGAIWNTREVRQALDAARPMGAPRILLHVDASQAVHTEKLTRAHFGADLMTLDASKVLEARGIGCLIAHRTIPLAPLYGGGGQERGLRPGSESPELAHAFADALARASAGAEGFRAEAAKMRARLLAELRDILGLLVNEGAKQAPHILNVSLPGRDTDYLVALLDEAGFAVSTKSACESDSEEGSRAVLALTGDQERAKSSLRISWGPGHSRSDLHRFGTALRESVAFIDSAGRA